MLCKSVKSNRFWTLMVIVGIITLIFGASYRKLPQDAHNMHMLMGMFSGLGGTFTAVGVIRLIYYKRTSAEKLKEKEIELTDERNIQILRATYSITSWAATLLFIAMAFMFVRLDYIIPAFVSIGALYTQLLAFLIAHKYFNRQM